MSKYIPLDKFFTFDTVPDYVPSKHIIRYNDTNSIVPKNILTRYTWNLYSMDCDDNCKPYVYFASRNHIIKVPSKNMELLYGYLIKY